MTSTIYETADGEDCLKKTVDTAYFTGKLGAVWSVGDMILRTKPTQIPGITRTFIYWTAPATAIGATYAATSCLVGGLRGKDSAVNHMIGAATAMSIVGLRAGPQAAFFMAMPAAFIAGILKQVKIAGYDIIPDKSRFRKDYGNFNHYRSHLGPRKDVDEPTNY